MEDSSELYNLPNRNIIDIRIINLYLLYVREGVFPPLLCPIDPHHTPMIAKLNDDDDVVIYCLAGDYNYTIGLNNYQSYWDKVHAAIAAGLQI